MKLELPYNKTELIIAFHSATEKMSSNLSLDEIENHLKEISSEFEANTNNINQAVADTHNITVEDLINSPNYLTLKQEYARGLFIGVVRKVKEKFNLTEIEAWSITVAEML